VSQAHIATGLTPPFSRRFDWVAAATAARALKKVKVAADIKFNRNTARLLQEDVQIATLARLMSSDGESPSLCAVWIIFKPFRSYDE
jgi:hypothetical protein